MADTKEKPEKNTPDETKAEFPPEHSLAGLRPGRIVDYVLPDGKTHAPAIVVSNWGDGQVELTVFQTLSPQYDIDTYSVPFDSVGKKPGSWHWLERAD